MEDSPSSLFIVGVSIILAKNSQVLLGKRSKSKNVAGGIWEFPSGRVDEGESPQQAVIREGFEELKISVEPIQLVDSYSFKRNGIDAILLNYWCRTNDEPSLGEEHDELNWFNIKNARKILPFDEQIKTLKHFEKLYSILREEFT